MEEKEYVYHGYYITEEIGNKTEVNKTLSTYGLSVTPHLYHVILDFFSFLEMSGYSKNVITETAREIMDLNS